MSENDGLTTFRLPNGETLATGRSHLYGMSDVGANWMYSWIGCCNRSSGIEAMFAMGRFPWIHFENLDVRIDAQMQFCHRAIKFGARLTYPQLKFVYQLISFVSIFHMDNFGTSSGSGINAEMHFCKYVVATSAIALPYYTQYLVDTYGESKGLLKLRETYVTLTLGATANIEGGFAHGHHADLVATPMCLPTFTDSSANRTSSANKTLPVTLRTQSRIEISLVNNSKQSKDHKEPLQFGNLQNMGKKARELKMAKAMICTYEFFIEGKAANRLTGVMPQFSLLIVWLPARSIASCQDEGLQQFIAINQSCIYEKNDLFSYAGWNDWNDRWDNTKLAPPGTKERILQSSIHEYYKFVTTFETCFLDDDDVMNDSDEEDVDGVKYIIDVGVNEDTKDKIMFTDHGHTAEHYSIFSQNDCIGETGQPKVESITTGLDKFGDNDEEIEDDDEL